MVELQRALSSLHLSDTKSLPSASLPSAVQHRYAARLRFSTDETIFSTDTLDGWLQPESSHYAGLMVKRPSHGRWDCYQSIIDEAAEARFGNARTLSTEALNGDPVHVRKQIGLLLEKAALPADLSQQIACDACNLGAVLGAMCGTLTRVLEIKLEVFGENSCNRWHRDNYAGRAIVSYTGAMGTQYTSDENVDFWELEHRGVNEHIIHDAGEICAAEVGDVLFMKGLRYPGAGAKGLTHKSPEKRYHADGRVVNRLVLKVDVPRD